MTFGRARTNSSSEERGRNTEPMPIMDDKVCWSTNHVSATTCLTSQQQRTNSYSSDFSLPESHGSSSPKSSQSWFKPAPQAVNVYTTCGRHTNQLLFGGPSLTEIARSMLKKD
ncbi:hypothetical protein FZEAL_2360 [Fusarium zealandicum]|uniref:Uncharacterized protein n=1 Tax=Fusarium zealandicum TaxID=1053134 RepID=A0A8H4XNY5_9HYPO|nr:hypothetical protein FZEAL_2360 [Fusarium zealandicum]